MLRGDPRNDVGCWSRGANIVKRHTRPNPQRNIKGGILEKEAPLDVSNVMPVDVAEEADAGRNQAPRRRSSVRRSPAASGAMIDLRAARERDRGDDREHAASYRDEIAPALHEAVRLRSPMAIPQQSEGRGQHGRRRGGRRREAAGPGGRGAGAITGQQPAITRARKSIASRFKLREGMPIGCRVTLRGRRMWEFLERLVNLGCRVCATSAACRTKGFDGRGNYTLGVREQLIFPEVNIAKVQKVKGMNICIVTSAENDDEARHLLDEMGMPLPFKN